MKKYFKFQISTAIFFTALFVTFGYEIKDIINVSDKVKPIIIILISFVLSSIMASVISNLLINRRFFRRLIFRENWIEGYWYNVDLAPQGDQSFLNDPAVTEIAFRDTDVGYETIGYRIRNNQEIYTFSQYVVLMGAQNLYINFSTSNTLGAFQNHIACGYFYRSPGRNILDVFDGVVMYADGSSSYRQRAKKIDDKKVKKLQKTYGSSWIKEFLANYEKYTSTDISLGSNK